MSGGGVAQHVAMPGHRAEGWPECFQDLASWCPPPQDELNTPKTLQDEFNFSIESNGQGRGFSWDNGGSPVHLDGNLWESQDVGGREGGQCGGKTPHALRTSGNLLLSQCGFSDPDLSEQKDLDLFSMLKSEDPHITASAAKLNSSPPPVIKTERADLERCVKVEKTLCDLGGHRPPAPGGSGGKSRLRLNVEAARAHYFVSADTPDVVKTLDESANFDLLSFVNGDFDDTNLFSADLSNLKTTGLEATRADPSIIKTDHDYTDARSDAEEGEGEEVRIKCEPASPGKRQPAKRRSTASSEEYVFESESDSDDSGDWSPTAYKKKRSKGKRAGAAKARALKKRKSLVVDSDGDSVVSGCDRYRELRDRNNEASRKSRLNRKQKEVDMIQMAARLERENVGLKNKAEALEKLVKKLREGLMNIVLKK